MLEEYSRWSNKQKHNIDLEAEVMIVFDLVKTVVRNKKNVNEGALKMCLDYKIFWELFKVRRLKARKMIELEEESKVQFEHARVKTKNEVEEIDNDERKMMTLS